MTLLLLNTTIKISLVVLAALAAMTTLRRRSAAVRHFVLAVSLACAAAVPAVRIVAPAWQPATRMQVIDRPLAVFDDTTAAPAGGASMASARAIATVSIMRAATIVWIGGAALALVALVAGLVRLSRMASRAERVTSGPWAETAADIARAYGLRRTPTVFHGDRPSVLGTWGVTRAKVLLPVDAPGWPADRIRIVLAHELAHVRRGDWIVQMAAELLRAVYWFNPLVWIACRRLRIESEQACDDAVLTLGVEGSTYASELVDLARAFKAAPFVPAAAIARPSSLERRVRAMLNMKLNRDPITRSASVAAICVLAVVTVLVAGFGVSAQTPFATVSGSVSDQNGRPIQGARLVLSNAAAQTKSEVKSDATGHYEFVGVQAGTYELTFESLGMAYLKREGLSVAGGQSVNIDAVMKIGSIEETITVTSADDGRPLARGYSGARPSDKPDPCAASANGGCIRPPTKIKDVRPVYPAGTSSGSVELIAVIDNNGYVTNLDVVGNGSGGPANIAQADVAAAAVRQWEFLPTHLDGQPIETNMKVHVRFSEK